MNIELIVDPEFVACIPPLAQDEFEQLERNILASGKIITPILVWNNTIVDGHSRYKILKRHPEIEIKTENVDFDNRYEAIAFICENQVSHRDIGAFPLLINATLLSDKSYKSDIVSLFAFQ